MNEAETKWTEGFRKLIYGPHKLEIVVSIDADDDGIEGALNSPNIPEIRVLGASVDAIISNAVFSYSMAAIPNPEKTWLDDFILANKLPESFTKAFPAAYLRIKSETAEGSSRQATLEVGAGPWRGMRPAIRVIAFDPAAGYDVLRGRLGDLSKLAMAVLTTGAAPLEFKLPDSMYGVGASWPEHAASPRMGNHAPYETRQ